jgi:hypothetical protein
MVQICFLIIEVSIPSTLARIRSARIVPDGKSDRQSDAEPMLDEFLKSFVIPETHLRETKLFQIQLYS